MKIFPLFLALLLWSGAAQVPQIPSDREEPAVSAGEAAVEAITAEEKCPVEDYVHFDLMTEASNY